MCPDIDEKMTEQRKKQWTYSPWLNYVDFLGKLHGIQVSFSRLHWGNKLLKSQTLTTSLVMASVKCWLYWPPANSSTQSCYLLLKSEPASLRGVPSCYQRARKTMQWLLGLLLTCHYPGKANGHIWCQSCRLGSALIPTTSTWQWTGITMLSEGR